MVRCADVLSTACLDCLRVTRHAVTIVQAEYSAGMALLQTKLDATTRELISMKSMCTEASSAAQSSSAMATALQRVVDDRTQELVICRGEIEALNSLAQQLHGMTVEAMAPSQGMILV